MIFIHPMWDSEGQRLGMKTCTPLGHALRCIGDMVGFFGLITFFVMPGFLVLRALRHLFSVHDLWLLLVPVVIGVMGRALFELGWSLAARKQFKYDHKSMTASWIEKGHEKSFPYRR